MNYPLHYPDFFTATILQWQKLLQPDKYKTIITNSLQFLVALFLKWDNKKGTNRVSMLRAIKQSYLHLG